MTDFGQLWVWRDPALSRSLGWYAAVAANQKPAKFRIAATIPVSLGLEDSSELALWEELDRLTPVFLSRWSEVRGGRAGLCASGRRQPARSLPGTRLADARAL